MSSTDSTRLDQPEDSESRVVPVDERERDDRSDGLPVSRSPLSGPARGVSPFDDLLEVLRGQHEATRHAALGFAFRIKAAADVYAAAVEHSATREVASKLGLPGQVASGPSVDEAVTALRALLDELPRPHATPEIVEAPQQPVEASPRVVDSPQATATPSASTEDIPPTPTPRRIFRDMYEASSDAKQLLREVRNADLEHMPHDLFKATASEYAARARSLQARGETAEDVTGQVIRKLTAIVSERGGTRIYGLARHHTGDWDLLAQQARSERQRIELRGAAATPGSPATKPERANVSREVTVVEVEPLPYLHAASHRNPLVLVGGLAVNEKIQWLKKRFDVEVEWVETNKGAKSIQTLESRIKSGSVTAVVVLDGLLGHVHYDPIVKATRLTEVPLVYADKGGTACLRKALSEIEDRLKGAA